MLKQIEADVNSMCTFTRHSDIVAFL